MYVAICLSSDGGCNDDRILQRKLTIITILSIILALSGIALLYKGNDGDVLNITGVILVMISSLTYAIYIIVVNKSPLRISSVKLTFYVLLFGVISLIIIRWQVTKTIIFKCLRLQRCGSMR